MHQQSAIVLFVLRYSLIVFAHLVRFCSSHELGEGVYVNSLQAAASILLSGNSFAKIERMAMFYGLALLSKSTLCRYQRLYLIPKIKEWWAWTR
jgi:hypothetical protein